MTHRARVDLLLAYHAGSLDESEARKVRALLSAGDPATVGASAEAVEMLARLSATAAPVAPRPAVRQTLLAGLAHRGAPAATPRIPADSLSRPGTFARNLALAASVLIAAGVGVWVVQPDRAALRARVDSAENAARARDQRVNELLNTLAAAEAGSAQARSALASMYSADARFGVLNPAAGDTARRQGRVIIDPANRQMQVYVFDLVAAPPGRTYQLWLLPDGGAPIPAPLFTVDASGKASISTTLPAGAPPIVGAAVSEEQAGGSTTGKPDVVKLVGKAG